MEGVRFIPCKICSAPSTGFHFGALTCEACKAFFRRVLKSGATLGTLTCSGTDPPPIDPLAAQNGGAVFDSVAVASGEAAQTPASGEQQQPRRCDLAFSPKKCPKCRYQRCLEVGMGPAASKIGRPTKGRVAEVREELHRLRPWLDFKAAKKDDGELTPTDARSSSLLMLASKDSRKRAALYGDGCSKKRHPSMPSSVYYSTSGASSQALASHVRHFSGDVLDSKFRPYMAMNDFDDADEDEDDCCDDDNFMCTNSEQVVLNGQQQQQQLQLQQQQQQQQQQQNTLLLRANSNPETDSKTSVITANNNATSVKTEFADASSTICQSGASSSTLSSPLSSAASPTPPATAILTVIQQYNNSGGNRQRFMQSLREMGADREGSNLFWLYSSADQWFDIATVMFQSPLAISNLISATSTSPAAAALPPPPPPPPPAPTVPDCDPLNLFSRVAAALPSTGVLSNGSINSSVNAAGQVRNIAPASQTSVATPSPLLSSSVFSPWPHALRSETMARQVVQATKHLASLNLSRQGLRPGALNITAPDLWGFLMQNFETNTAHIINFARSIPGFSMITSVQDRAVLAMNSFFPLLFANMSIEFDPVSENIMLYWMGNNDSDENALACARSVLFKNPVEAALNSAEQNGSTMKSANLSVVEFGFLCALIHFNPAIRGLQDPISVEMVASELMSAVEYFINTNFPNPSTQSDAARIAFSSVFLTNGPMSSSSLPSVAANRIVALNKLVSYFRNLNSSSNWITTEMGTAAATAAAAAATTTSTPTPTTTTSTASHSAPVPPAVDRPAAMNGDDAVREMYRKMIDIITSPSVPTSSSSVEASLNGSSPQSQQQQQQQQFNTGVNNNSATSNGNNNNNNNSVSATNNSTSSSSTTTTTLSMSSNNHSSSVGGSNGGSILNGLHPNIFGNASFQMPAFFHFLPPRFGSVGVGGIGVCQPNSVPSSQTGHFQRN